MSREIDKRATSTIRLTPHLIEKDSLLNSVKNASISLTRLIPRDAFRVQFGNSEFEAGKDCRARERERYTINSTAYVPFFPTGTTKFLREEREGRKSCLDRQGFANEPSRRPRHNMIPVKLAVKSKSISTLVGCWRTGKRGRRIRKSSTRFFCRTRTRSHAARRRQLS